MLSHPRRNKPSGRGERRTPRRVRCGGGRRRERCRARVGRRRRRGHSGGDSAHGRGSVRWAARRQRRPQVRLCARRPRHCAAERVHVDDESVEQRGALERGALWRGVAPGRAARGCVCIRGGGGGRAAAWRSRRSLERFLEPRKVCSCRRRHGRGRLARGPHHRVVGDMLRPFCSRRGLARRGSGEPCVSGGPRAAGGGGGGGAGARQARGRLRRCAPYACSER
mmetsp:Transcript_1405/g.5193  ORF Transcript_1405/g.5193 Transcript_1405/m.5193 type:complete len:224 (+) Transcript_1405:56-727(+)